MTRLTRWLSERCAACRGFDPHTEQISVWPTDSCSGSSYLFMKLFYVCKRTHEAAITPNVGQRLLKITNPLYVKNVFSELTFKEDTYEGGAYPPMLTPDADLNLYRQGVCRTWHLENIGSRMMDYGGEALVYGISNRTFIKNVNPITSKTYPDGLMDIAECFYSKCFLISLLDLGLPLVSTFDSFVC